MRASDTVQTFFDEVKVPVRYTIGQPGSGFIYQMQQFQEERLWAGAGTLMGCDRIINATIDYTRERKVFGRPLLDNQVIHFRLAELKSEVEALRSLVYRACEDYLAGIDVTMLASMAKLKAGRLRREVSDACLQYWGGAGYLWDSPGGAQLPRRPSRLDRRRRRRGHAADHLQADGHPAPAGQPMNHAGSAPLQWRSWMCDRRRCALEWRAPSKEHAVQFTPEHAEIRRTLRAIIDKDINPHVDKWEEDEIFPAHEVFKKLGDAGLLGHPQARRVRRHGPRLFLRHGDGRGAGPHQLRLGAHGDRRADRHGDAGAGALRQRRAAQGVPGALDRRRLRRLPRRLRSGRGLRRRLASRPPPGASAATG